MTGHNETHADVGRTGTNGVAADRMIVAYSRSNGAATNCEIARGDRGAAAPEGRGRFLDPDRSRAPMVADPMVSVGAARACEGLPRPCSPWRAWQSGQARCMLGQPALGSDGDRGAGQSYRPRMRPMISFMISVIWPKTGRTRPSRPSPTMRRRASGQRSAGQGRGAPGQREPRRPRGANWAAITRQGITSPRRNSPSRGVTPTTTPTSGPGYPSHRHRRQPR